MEESSDGKMKGPSQFKPMMVLRDRYGSVEGFCAHFAAFARFCLQSREVTIDWSRVTRLVYVCKGNVCRSPFAEALTKTHAIPARSFGIHATTGTRVDKRAREVARKFNVDLSGFESRLWTADEIGPGDLVLCMEPGQCAEVSRDVRAGGGQLTLLGLYNKRQRPYIHDPYGMSGAYFIRCFERIAEAVEGLRKNYQYR